MKYPSNIGYRYPTTFICYRYPTSIRCRYLTNIEWYLMNIGSETYYIMISFRLKCHTFFYRYMYFEWWAYNDGFDTDCIGLVVLAVCHCSKHSQDIPGYHDLLKQGFSKLVTRESDQYVLDRYDVRTLIQVCVRLFTSLATSVTWCNFSQNVLQYIFNC